MSTQKTRGDNDWLLGDNVINVRLQYTLLLGYKILAKINQYL